MRYAYGVWAKIVWRSCTICGFHSSSCQPMNFTRRWSLFCSGLVLKVIQRTNLHSTSELLPMVFISWRSSLVEHNGTRRITSCRRTIGLFFFFAEIFSLLDSIVRLPQNRERKTKDETTVLVVLVWDGRLSYWRSGGLVVWEELCVWWAAAWLSGGLKIRHVADDIDTVSSSVWSPHSSHTGADTICKYSMIP